MTQRYQRIRSARATVLAATLTLVLVGAAGLTAVLAGDEDDVPPPTASERIAAISAERQAYIDSLKVPSDLRSLPRKVYEGELAQDTLRTFDDMLGGSQDAAEAVVRGKVGKVLNIRSNRIEVVFEVSDVLARRPDVAIGNGPIVLVQKVTFDGPPLALVYSPRATPLFEGDEGILFIRHRSTQAHDEWMALLDRGTYLVDGDTVTAMTLGTDGAAEKRPPDTSDIVEQNAVIDWAAKYNHYPLSQFTNEVHSAAAIRGWQREAD